MKRLPPSDQNDRFSGNLRHYHRSGVSTQRSWEEWIEGDQAKIRRPSKWPKILLAVMALLALGGIIIGLVVELA